MADDQKLLASMAASVGRDVDEAGRLYSLHHVDNVEELGDVVGKLLEAVRGQQAILTRLATPSTETEPPAMESEGEAEWLVRIEYRHARRHLAYEVTLCAATDAAAIEAAEQRLLQEKPGAAILTGQAVPIEGEDRP